MNDEVCENNSLILGIIGSIRGYCGSNKRREKTRAEKKLFALEPKYSCIRTKLRLDLKWGTGKPLN